MTHVGPPPAAEINGNLIALNALAGIPFDSIKGSRAPFLNYTNETFHLLAAADFMYDSSTTPSIPVADLDTDAYWPYTLDYGLANDCLTVDRICRGQPQIPGFWEIPMYAFFDEVGVDGLHLMDPWLDTENGAQTVNDTATLEYMTDTLTAHYNENRQPIGLYAHPIHLSVRLSFTCGNIFRVLMHTPDDVPRCRRTHLDHQHARPVPGLAPRATRCTDRTQWTTSRLGPELRSGLSTGHLWSPQVPDARHWSHNAHLQWHTCQRARVTRRVCLFGFPVLYLRTCRPLAGQGARLTTTSISTAVHKSSHPQRIQIRLNKFLWVNKRDSDVSPRLLFPRRRYSHAPPPIALPLSGTPSEPRVCTSDDCTFVDNSRPIGLRLCRLRLIRT